MSAPSNSNSTSFPAEVPAGTGPAKPATGVRDRTLRHMRRLLAKATIAGAALQATNCVIDPPPPPPVTCGEILTNDQLFAAIASTQATWAQGASAPVIELRLDTYVTSNLAFSGQAMLEGATLDAIANWGYALTVICTPAEGATTVKVDVPMTCDSETPLTLQLMLDVSGTHQPGDYITITPVD